MNPTPSLDVLRMELRNVADTIDRARYFLREGVILDITPRERIHQAGRHEFELGKARELLQEIIGG